MELTEIFGLLYPFADAFIKNVINNIGLDIIKNKKEKEIIEREKNKTIEELHELIDANEDNWIIISGDFYNFIKYNAGDLISQLLETNSYTYSTKSKESEVKQLLELYDTNFCGVSSFEKSLGTDFIKRFFEVCFKFKKNLFIALIHGDTKHVLEYELNENMLLKINENIESVLECFQKVSDYIELKSTNIQEIKEISINADGRKSVEYFSELFENPLIFEEKENAKRLKDVFVWPEYKSNLLKNKQDDLEQLIYEFLKGNLRIFLYNKGVPKLKIESNYNLCVIFGMAGMGKSSLLEKIAYDIIHNAILINENNIFFVKFSSMECKHKSLLENIASNLGVEKSILKNSTIILDAFDEFILKDVEKQKMLELFCQEIVFLNSKVIITSRENYIDTCSLQNTFAIKLLSFNVNKRKEWLNKYDKNLPAKVIEDICNYRDETDLEGE